MKAAVDKVMEEAILARLLDTGIPILSEECGDVVGSTKSGLKFIVDPLDGTVNFVRELGLAAISVALYRGKEPVFGVLGLYPGDDIAWGGKTIGSFLNDQQLRVSEVSNLTESVLCTGFPSRFQFDDSKEVSKFIQKITRLGKVRMLGSASVSLLKVAQGSAEIYAENDIMLWDVAAGLALVEGAGGDVKIKPGKSSEGINVIASNGNMKF